MISLLNKTASSSLSHEEVEDVIGELIDYTRNHFAREEAIMKVCGFPDIAKHHEMHQDLIGQVNNMATVAWHSDKSDEPRLKLHTYLQNWLYDHIVNEDAKLAKYAKGRDQEIKQALASLK